ncbi:MAG TPA: CpsB/CapC family capsule biosynthesis tyrosine phosphatase [Candidatus Polarisedimenticolaceae bacterium]|nr:CpsB/CapC family capsule biosynthesis tyrosine phosphatase [Candidatus Polarisedimenticolaceae bacterium]
MIDLHTHILPGVDDGVKTMEDAIDFARVAVDDGVRTVVATPHYRDGFYVNARQDVVAGVAALRARLAQEGIGLEVLPGAEIHMCADLIERVQAGHATTLADNGKTVLFELSMSQYPIDLEDFVFRMRLAGLQVLFAHPERIRFFQDDVRRYEAVIRLGAFGQITTGSITGLFGSDIEVFSEELVRKRLVHVMASDAHNTRGRPPVLTAAMPRLASWAGGEQSAHLMVEGTPRALLEGRDPELPPLPDPPQRKRSVFSRWLGRD